MTSDTVDVLVIGGGINGVGVAQAAVAAGHRTLLLEKSALGDGTSSRSSKLVHGGLRYLETFEFSLVRESLAERALMLQLAPDLVTLKPFFVPVYRSTRRSPLLVRAGLSLYALLGGLDNDNRFRKLQRREWDQLDGLVTDDLLAVYQYNDGQTDDRALTRAVMQSAESLGATARLGAEFVGATLTDEGCRVRYRQGEHEHECAARVVVNAAGPWANAVLDRFSPTQHALAVDLVQGTHILLDWHVDQGIYYVEAPRDGRAVFVMPRQRGQTLVGTTEVRFTGNPDEVAALDAEVRYLQNVIAHYFPDGAEARAVLGATAGLRVLPTGEGHAFKRSRETIYHTDRTHKPRVLTIYGGKLTAWRATAEHALAHIAPSLPTLKPVADTKALALTPAAEPAPAGGAGAPCRS
ncbi:MAG: FAD-dependent oxidoreductase [Pseudomonadota bacterium]